MFINHKENIKTLIKSNLTDLEIKIQELQYSIIKNYYEGLNHNQQNELVAKLENIKEYEAFIKQLLTLL